MPKANAAGMISLQNEKDYTYKYLNNKEPGTATLQITGKGNFTGTKKIAYKISKAKQPVKVTPGSITKLYTDKDLFFTNDYEQLDFGHPVVEFRYNPGEGCVEYNYLTR